MFRTQIWICILLAVGSWANGQQYSQRYPEGGRAHQGNRAGWDYQDRNVRQVAGGSQQGGFFQKMFGSGSPSRSRNGAIPDAPAGRGGAVQDWSDIAHDPKGGTAYRGSNGRAGNSSERSSGMNVSPNLPRPPAEDAVGSGLVQQDLIVIPKGSSKSSGSASTSKQGGTVEDRIAKRPREETEPKVSRRPIPQRSQLGYETSTGSGGTKKEVSESPRVAAETNRQSRPTKTDEADSSEPSSELRSDPSIPPSLSPPKPKTANSRSDSGSSARDEGASNEGWVSARPSERTRREPPRVSSENLSQSGGNDPKPAARPTPNIPLDSPVNVPANGPLAASSSSNAVMIGTANAQEVPGVRVSTKGPERISINETVDYEIIVENRGASEAPGMLLRAGVPHGTVLRGHQVTSGDAVSEQDGSRRALIWTIDRLAPGGMEKLTLRLTPEKATAFEVKTEWTFLPQTTVSRIQVEEPKLDLIIEGPDEVIFGQTQLYRVRVRNPGTGTANGVVFTLSPKSATPQSQRMGDIPPGKEAQFEIELSAQDRGELAIHGLVTGGGDLRSEAIKKIRVAAAELVATLNGVPLVYQNSETVYQLILQNEGTATCRAVAANLRIPSGIEYLGGINDGESKGNIIRWTVPELSPGQKVEYQFRCRMVSTGSHMLTFEGNGSAAGIATVSLSTKVEAIADLVMHVNDPPAPAPAGKEVLYEILLKNRGSKAATQINAVAMYSNQIEPQRAEGQSGKISDGKVVFDTIDRLEAGQEIRLRIYAVASQGGTHRFRAEVTSGDTVVVSEKATRYIQQGSDRVSRSSNENKIR